MNLLVKIFVMIGSSTTEQVAGADKQLLLYQDRIDADVALSR